MPGKELSLIRENNNHGDLFTLAKLAEQTERYEDMVQAVGKIVVMAKVLSMEERNLLSVGYKNAIGARRATWRIISSTEESQGGTRGIRRRLLREYREKVEKEIRNICAGILELLEKYLIPHSEQSDAKVFFFKMQGDYYRYLAEIEEGEERKKHSSKALAAYKFAADFSSDLQPTHPNRLGLALNFSVFYYEIYQSRQKARKLAKDTLDGAIRVLGAAEGDGRFKESTLIMQVLRDNLTLWDSEMQVEDGDEER